MNLWKKKKETFEDLEEYDDEMAFDSIDDEIKEEKYSKKNPQIMETYPLEDSHELNDISLDEDYDDYEEYIDKKKKKKNLPRIIMNIVFGLILMIGILVTIDVVMVSKFEKGPFFAIRTNIYKDGGTKEYIGLGYKVIKYNQIVGRRDMEIGTWSLSYSTTPVDISDLDFSIEYVKDPETTAKNYHHKFIRMKSTVKEVNVEKNNMNLEYFDEDGKYTIHFVCHMAEKAKAIKTFNKGDEVSILGTMREFKVRPNTIELSDCFAEEYIEISEE